MPFPRILNAAFACLLAACDGPVKEDPNRLDAGTLTASPGVEGSACSPGRRVMVSEVDNARDLGATALEDGRTVACGALYRGAELARLSGQGCLEFSQVGIRTIVDLRTPSERATSPNAACVTQSARVVVAPMPVPYDVSPDDYLADLRATASVAEAFRTLGDETAYPVYFHCVWGRDRTGVLAAVILLALGVTRDDVLEEYLLSQATVGAYPDSLNAVLDEIERLGGVEAYLASAGIPDGQLATLRARAIAR